MEPRTALPGLGAFRAINASLGQISLSKTEAQGVCFEFRNAPGALMSSIRIAPLNPPYDDEVREQLDGMMPPGVPPILLFRTFAKNLPMVRAMRTWGGYELGRSCRYRSRDREIVIDRTCARCGCGYEWGVHVAYFAERAGLAAEQVASLTHGTADDPCWSSTRATAC